VAVRRRGCLLVPLGALLLVLSLCRSVGGAEQGLEDILQEQLSQVDASEIDRWLEEWRQSLGREFPAVSWRDAVEVVRGRGVFIDVPALLRALAAHVGRELVASARLLVQLLALGIVAAFLGQLELSPGRGDVARVGGWACFAGVALLAVTCFAQALQLAQATVRDAVTFMQAILLPLTSLLAASGAPVSAGLLHPLAMLLVQGGAVLVADLVFPLLAIAALLEVATLSVGSSLEGPGSLLRQVAFAVLGGFLAILLWAMSAKRVAGQVADSVALRTAKFLSGAFVPVVGKMLGDAVEMVFTSSLILRRALGLIGVLGVFLAMATPVIKLACLVLLWRTGAVLAGAVGTTQSSRLMNAMAGALLYLLLPLLALGVLFAACLGQLAAVALPY